MVFTVFQSGGGLPKCAPHPAEHSTESAFSGVYSLPDLLRVFSYVCCVLCVVCCALCVCVVVGVPSRAVLCLLCVVCCGRRKEEGGGKEKEEKERRATVKVKTPR